jgi:penicillin-binding protein 2
MVSRPTFDPNQFLHLSRTYWQTIVNDPQHPLLNKAIQAQLAPGSTFKIIMSLAGLQEGIAQTMHVQCNGGADFYGHYFKCDAHHGTVTIDNAIPWSCDTFYYTLANRLGIETIARYAKEVGLSQKTGIDLPDEAAGLMPSEEWKLKTQHDKWYAGETISVGIGQGAIQATPIQMVRALAGIASGGVLKRPHVIFDDELSPEELSAEEASYPGSGDKTIPITPQNWQIITDGMAQTTQPGGFDTAAAAHLQGIDFAGKTGTAQVVGHDSGKSGHATIPNAWFVGVAPRRNPDIAVAVLWENGNWGNNSAKLAAQVIDAFVEKQRAHAGNLQKVAASEPPQIGTASMQDSESNRTQPSSAAPAAASPAGRRPASSAPAHAPAPAPKPMAHAAALPAEELRPAPAN